MKAHLIVEILLMAVAHRSDGTQPKCNIWLYVGELPDHFKIESVEDEKELAMDHTDEFLEILPESECLFESVNVVDFARPVSLAIVKALRASGSEAYMYNTIDF